MNKAHQLLAVVLLAASAAAWAQYKVIGPDGKVTYTDRPQDNTGKVTNVRASTGGSVDRSLPFALRGVAERFPVTLFTAKDCGEACSVARSLLQRRGIPHQERTIESREDQVAYERLGLGGMVPAVRIGGQVHSGFNEDQWNNTLNLAGYPERSALPANYKAPSPGPLTDRVAPVAPPVATAAASAPAPVRTDVPVDTTTNPSGIRF
jgi:glutaredoxin